MRFGRLKDVFSLGSKTRRPKLIDLLKPVLPEEAFFDLRRLSLAPEDLFSLAANSIHVSEDELLLRIGRANRIPTLFRLAPLLARHELESKSIHCWREARCVPVRWSIGGGFACLDPHRIPAALFGHSAFLVTTPAQIRAALGEDSEPSETPKTQTLEISIELARALGRVLYENGAASVDITFNSGGAEYSFFDSEGRLARGEISSLAAGAIRESVLEPVLCREAGCLIEARSGGLTLAWPALPPAGRRSERTNITAPRRAPAE